MWLRYKVDGDAVDDPCPTGKEEKPANPSRKVRRSSDQTSSHYKMQAEED